MKKLIIILGMCVILLPEACFGQRFKSIDRTFNTPDGKELYLYIEGDAGTVMLNRSSKDNEGYASIRYNRSKASADIYYDDNRSELILSVDNDSWKHDASDTKIEVDIPKYAATYLDCRIKAGDFRIDMGGIHVKGFNMKSWAGQAVIDFSRPNPEIIDRLKIDLNFGEMDVIDLGNANFNYAVIDGAAGLLKVDLRGEYKRDARVDLDLEIGELIVTLPDDRKIGIKMKVSKWGFLASVNKPSGMRKRGRYYYSDNYDDADIKLFVNIRGGMGEVSIRWD